MKIRYQSQNGIPSVNIPAIRDRNWSTWRNGEEREVPEDLRVPVIPRPGRAERSAKLYHALLMAGPEFVDADTGVNPDFSCKVDGKVSLEDGFVVTDAVTGNPTHVDLEDADGNRLCLEHFLAAHPQWIETIAGREGVDGDMIARVRQHVLDNSIEVTPASTGANAAIVASIRADAADDIAAPAPATQTPPPSGASEKPAAPPPFNPTVFDANATPPAATITPPAATTTEGE